MKLHHIIPILIAISPVMGRCDDDVLNQILDSQIKKLETERDEKYAKLKECERATKNFKIAGSVTLALTAAGVAANITLAAQRASLGAGASGGASSTPTDNAPQEEKDCKSLASMCDMGITEACSQKC